jgi:hypothetical protein
MAHVHTLCGGNIYKDVPRALKRVNSFSRVATCFAATSGLTLVYYAI